MTTKPKFKSDAFEAIHSSALALRKVGAIDKLAQSNDERTENEAQQYRKRERNEDRAPKIERSNYDSCQNCSLRR